MWHLDVAYNNNNNWCLMSPLLLTLSVRSFVRSCHLKSVYILSRSYIIFLDPVRHVLQMRNKVLEFVFQCKSLMILYSSTYGSTNLLESEKCDWSNRINMYHHGQSYSYITRPRLANYEIDPTNTFHWHLRVKTINVGPMLYAKVLRRHWVFKLVWKNFHEQYTTLKHCNSFELWQFRFL